LKNVKVICLLISLLILEIYSDTTLLQKFSHKTSFSLEQLVFKAEYIFLAVKLQNFVNTKEIKINKKTKCPPYISESYNFKILDTIKSTKKIIPGTSIKVKEPFSDLSYTVHYSYYTRGFVIEPFTGEYRSSIALKNLDTLIIFVNEFSAKTNPTDSSLFQFCIFNAFEKPSKKKEIIEILNRPAPDMKRLFLRHK
jgi:hypothetical protein